MNDIGSDSDATIADDAEEEDDNSDCSTSSSSHTAVVDNPSCVVSSLQRKQKVLLDKLQRATAEATSVQHGNFYHRTVL